MRHGKDFMDEQGQRVGGFAGIHVPPKDTTPTKAQANVRDPAAPAEAAKRPASRSALTVEEMTDRIYRRYAVN